MTQTKTRKSFIAKDVPWQIWVVVVLLGLEGISNYLMLAKQPIAVIWLGVKVLFIFGLLKKWKWVYVLLVIVGLIHVIFFAAAAAIIVSLINLALVILAASVFRYYFPKKKLNI